MSPLNSTKYLQPTTTTTTPTTPSTTSYHLDSDNEAHSDCSPRGSISLATSDDNLLPVSTAPHPHPQQTPKPPPRRPAPRTVHFAEKSQLTTSTPAPVYPPLNKSQKAKQVATSTLKGAGTVAGGIFGCICFIFAKACILDGGAGLSGSGSRVVVARAGEHGFVQGNRRVVEMDARGYEGCYDEEKRRAQVPARVRAAQHRTRSAPPERRSYRAPHTQH